MTSAKLRHLAENVFHADPCTGFAFIRGFLSVRQPMVPRVSLANLRDETHFEKVLDVNLTRIAGVRKYVSVCRFRVQKVLEMLRVMYVRGRDDKLSDKFSLSVNAHVQLVTEVIFPAFLRPASVQVLVRTLAWSPFFRGFARLRDGFVILRRVASNRDFGKRRIHDLPAFGLETGLAKKVLKFRKKPVQ